MEYSYLRKMGGILFHPSATFRGLRGESPADALMVFASGLVFLTGIITFATAAGCNRSLCWPWSSISAMFPTPMYIPFYLGMGGIFLLGGGFSLHFSARIFSFLVGWRGIINTYRAIMYATVPVFFFSWIPVLGFIALPWFCILFTIALRELHRISCGLALAAEFGI